MKSIVNSIIIVVILYFTIANEIMGDLERESFEGICVTPEEACKSHDGSYYHDGCNECRCPEYENEVGVSCTRQPCPRFKTLEEHEKHCENKRKKFSKDWRD